MLDHVGTLELMGYQATVLQLLWLWIFWPRRLQCQNVGLPSNIKISWVQLLSSKFRWCWQVLLAWLETQLILQFSRPNCWRQGSKSPWAERTMGHRSWATNPDHPPSFRVDPAMFSKLPLKKDPQDGLPHSELFGIQNRSLGASVGFGLILMLFLYLSRIFILILIILTSTRGHFDWRT